MDLAEVHIAISILGYDEKLYQTTKNRDRTARCSESQKAQRDSSDHTNYKNLIRSGYFSKAVGYYGHRSNEKRSLYPYLASLKADIG